MELQIHRDDYLIIPQITAPNPAPTKSTSNLGASSASTAAFRADALACARPFRDSVALMLSTVREVEVAVTCVAEIPTTTLGMALAPRVAVGPASLGGWPGV